jgi:hypothetical protein
MTVIEHLYLEIIKVSKVEKIVVKKVLFKFSFSMMIV